MFSVRKLTNLWSAAVFLAACGQGPGGVDGFGDPAGYSRVEGVVTRTSGVPVADAEVLITRCDSQGLSALTRTNSGGQYSAMLKLPPTFIFPSAGVSVACDFAVNKTLVKERVSLTFGRTQETSPLLTVNLVVN